MIGVTGSVGKTSVKDLLAAALKTTWATAASHKSFNNELGVPITLLGAPDDTEAVVVEMGARSVGHIAELCAVARPTVGVITRVAAAHLEVFGTIEEVARAKGELVEALPAEGWAVLNADDPLVHAMAKRGSASVITFGDAGEVRAVDVELDAELLPRFRLLTPWGEHDDVRLQVRGRHQVVNALAAAAAALVVEVTLDEVVAGLAGGSLSPWRMELHTAANGCLVLNDAYNANPASMEAALESFAEIPASTHTALLGEMAELGGTATAEHKAVVALARSLGIDVVAYRTDRYGVDTVVATLVEAAERLGGLRAGDALLLKGSRVAGLDVVADHLLTQVLR